MGQGAAYRFVSVYGPMLRRTSSRSRDNQSVVGSDSGGERTSVSTHWTPYAHHILRVVQQGMSGMTREQYALAVAIEVHCPRARETSNITGRDGRAAISGIP